MRYAIVGQTASGKSDLAIELALRLGKPACNGIVSADAYQLYRLMDIGTAKVLPDERQGIEHFQIDVLDIDEDASVAAYQRHARADCQFIEARGGTVFLAGGSGLYVRAVCDNLDFPPTDPQLRSALQERARVDGVPCLHRELADMDPLSAKRIPADNRRRVIRALEVCILTGRPFSATLPSYTYCEPWLQIGIRWADNTLRQRIERRSRAMFDEGWLDEISVLMKHGFDSAPTASRAVGYPQAVSVWKGEIGIDEGIEQVANSTWKLTKKQWKWFKRDPRIMWIDGEDALEKNPSSPGEELVKRAVETIESQAR